MSIDWLHMVVSVLLIFATLLLVQRAPAYKTGSRGKRAVIFGVSAGIVIFIFNLIWPDGEKEGVMGELMYGREGAIEQRTDPTGDEVPDRGN